MQEVQGVGRWAGLASWWLAERWLGWQAMAGLGGWQVAGWQVQAGLAG